MHSIGRRTVLYKLSILPPKSKCMLEAHLRSHSLYNSVSKWHVCPHILKSKYLKKSIFETYLRKLQKRYLHI